MMGEDVREIRIGTSAELKENSSLKFVIPTPKYDREGFAIRRQGRIYAYYNECAHISLPLDWNDGDFFSADHEYLVCKNHGAEFIPESGECTLGPCRGASLKPIPIIERGGDLFAQIH